MVNRMTKSRGRKAGRRKKKGGFVYKKRSSKAMKERAERTGGQFDTPIMSTIDVWRPKVGENLIRFLPPTWDDHDHYGHTIWVHRRIGPDNSTYLCLRKMKDETCSLCQASREAKEAGDVDEAKDLRAAELLATWIIDRDEDDPQPQIYLLSWTMDRDIAALCYNKRTGKVLLIDHPNEGYDVTMKRQGQGLKTRYFGISIDRDPTPVMEDDDEQKAILDYIIENPVPSVLNYYEDDYIEKVFAGEMEKPDKDLDDDDNGDDDDDDEPKKKKGKRRSTSRKSTRKTKRGKSSGKKTSRKGKHRR